MNDREWLYANYEQFCKNSELKYMPAAISAHLDKLDTLRDMCQERKLPFCKLAAIALGTWYDNGHLMSTTDAFENECVRLYNIHPEWFENCGVTVCKCGRFVGAVYEGHVCEFCGGTVTTKTDDSGVETPFNFVIPKV